MAGLTKRGSFYYVVWRDHHGIVRRRSTGKKDKGSAETIKRKIEHEIQIDRIDPYAKWRRVPLTEHADNYRQYQLSLGTSQKQADQVHARITRILDTASIRYVAELSVSKVTTTIDKLRKVPQSRSRKPETYPTLSLRTKNFYAKAIKQLTRWMLHEQRIERDPLERLTMRKVDTDIRHDRRALTDNEFQKLVRAAESSVTTVEGLDGIERALLYKIARFTGLRKSELASLTAESFTLKRRDPFLVVDAAYSKHRERDVLPLHPELVPIIEEKISGLVNGAALFPMLAQRKTCKMIRSDLKDAKIPYQDEQGRFADFHALRHSFISHAWESGATPDVVMALARHRSLSMTMRYTHVDRSAQFQAMRSMSSPLANGNAAK